MTTTERMQPPGGPPGAGAPPGRRTPEIQGDPFQALLDLHEARTAPAEGKRGGRDSAPDPEETPAALAPQGVESGDEGGTSGPAPAAPTDAAAAPGELTSACIAPAMTLAVPTESAAAPAAAPASLEPVPAGGGTHPAVPAPEAAEAAPAAPAAEPVEATVLDQAAPRGPIQEGVTGAAPGAAPKERGGETALGAVPKDHDGSEWAPGAESRERGSGPARRAAAAQPSGSAQPATPAQPAQPNGPGQPATPAQPAVPAQGHATRAHGEPVRHARLDQAAETVEATIRLAAQRGAGHARIALKPAELGGVEIRLRHTTAGLTATVVAEAPEAAQALQHAVAELRRSLEDQGLQVLRLDVGVADDRQQAGHGAGAAGEDHPRGRDDRRGEAGDALADDDPAAEAETVQLPNGVLIDVIA